MILIIDDDKRLYNCTVKVLEMHNKTVEVISEASEAVGFVEERREEIDLIILDIDMPNGDTIEVLKSRDLVIRDLDGYSGELLYDFFDNSFDIPILVHSIVRDKELIRKIQGDGRLFLVKPISVRELMDHVFNIVKK